MGSISKDKQPITGRSISTGKIKKGESLAIVNRYHNSEIEINEFLIKQSVRVAWMGIFMIAAGVFYTMFCGYNWEKLLTVIPGSFVSLVSGIILHLVNKSSENKQKYFDSLTKLEHERVLIEMIQKEESPEFRQQAIEKILNK